MSIGSQAQGRGEQMKLRDGWLTAGMVCLSVLCVGLMGLVAIKPNPQPAPRFISQFDLEGSQMAFSWNAWFDVSPEAMAERLSDWDSSADLVDSASGFKLEQDNPDSATFRIQRRSPVLKVDPSFTIQAQMERDTDGGGVMTWRKTHGIVNRFEKRWRFTPEQGGTRVELNAVVELPFDPPGFLTRNPSYRIARSVELFRKHVGANVARLEAPNHPAHKSPSAACGFTSIFSKLMR